jgi:hypothetical protein
MFGWTNTNAAWLITPAMAGGPQFSMYQVSDVSGHLIRFSLSERNAYS